MEQLNQITLRGRVGTVQTNVVGEKQVCNFSVATNLLYRSNDTGTATEEVTWHSCKVWSSKKNPDLGIITVGAGIELVGRIRTSKYEGSDGVQRERREVNVSDFTILPASEPLRAESYV